MKTHQTEHELEQLEALRAEFKELWTARIQPAMNELELIPRNRVELIEHCAWIAFTEGRARQGVTA
jgi:hypothetical protein